MGKLRILAISDTHGFHGMLKLPKELDMIIHGGDFGNYSNPARNSIEALNFLVWYNMLPVKYKVLIAGNHDTSIEAGLVDPRKYETITFLHHETQEVGGLKIFGSPYTPSFGVGWAYNVSRSKLDPYWDEIPDELDILVTHGPPKGVLDLTRNRGDELEYCGDKALLNHVLEKQPRVHIFGHIHNFEDCINVGTRKIEGVQTLFINATAVTDRKFDLGLTSHGTYFEL
jgi:Icc-related predicted phosphoesterase